jgi:hypothetical protein
MWPISARFEQALKSPVHEMRATMEVLDTDFNVVRVFTDSGAKLAASSYLVDGSVDLDISRPIRRTFTANLLNPDGEFSPGSDWSGLFYVNRMVRLYRGVAFGEGSNYELVPIGTFMIDHADIVVERNMSMVVLSGSDLWKKLSKSIFTKPQSWAAGTSLITVIKQIADGAGVTRFVDDLSDDRPANARDLNKKLSVEQGDNRGETIQRLATAYGLDVYFDQLGRMVIADFKSPEDTRTVWTFDPDQNAMLLSVRTTYKDDQLYNSVLVIGTGGKDPVFGRKRDTDPTSVTSIDRIGERVFKYETDTISTQEAADEAARKLFYQHILLTEDIALDAICNPALDGNDVISVREPDFAKLNRRYRVRGLTVPLASSRQQLRLLRNINLG